MLVRVEGAAPSSPGWKPSILLLDHTRLKNPVLASNEITSLLAQDGLKASRSRSLLRCSITYQVSSLGGTAFGTGVVRQAGIEPASPVRQTGIVPLDHYRISVDQGIEPCKPFDLPD